MNLNQKGRSMVEMLGVLAIIGILSAGAMAGYSKAIIQHRLNRHTEQINSLIMAVTKNYEAMRQDGDDDWSPILINTGDVPADMLKNGATHIEDAFRVTYSIENRYYANPPYIGIFGYISKSETSQMACENVFKVASLWHQEIWYTALLVDSSGVDGKSWYGDQYCSEQKCIKDIKISDISKICDVCEDEKMCRFVITWKR